MHHNNEYIYIYIFGNSEKIPRKKRQIQILSENYSREN